LELPALGSDGFDIVTIKKPILISESAETMSVVDLILGRQNTPVPSKALPLMGTLLNFVFRNAPCTLPANLRIAATFNAARRVVAVGAMPTNT
jgi:hypothetical protein